MPAGPETEAAPNAHGSVRISLEYKCDDDVVGD